MTPIIYTYEPETRHYTGTSKADPDPLDASNWLVPADATLVAVGEDKPDHVQVFDPTAQKWVYEFIQPPAPSAAHDWDDKKQGWVLNKNKQSELDAVALVAAKSAALAAAVRYADELQAAILGETSPAAQARLMSKYTAAVAIKSGADTAGDHAVIDAEVMLRDKYTKAELVDVIIAKGTAAKQAEGMINGMLLLAQDAFESAQTIEELGERVEAITAQADALKSKLLAAMVGAA